ncbi:MAG TPA: biotin/lipoyl-binding protein, partial [Rectinemataceae bacterium]|nr:biotin/lipoyl-binding protein [Rectinemataceae bacterium]
MKKMTVAALAAVLLLLAAGCSKSPAKAAGAAKGDAGGDPAAQTAFAVATVTAQRGQINDYLALSGDVVSASTVDVYPDVAGKVTRLLVELGARVQRDQSLVEVDPSRPGMNFVASQ